jgi:hypothetical protein
MTLQRIDLLLKKAGEIVGDTCITLMGLTRLVGTIVGGWAVSFLVGMGAAMLVGGGTVGVILFFSVAFTALLFLSVYVRQPHVWPAVKRGA